MRKPIRPKEIVRRRNRRLIAVTVSLLLALLFAFGYCWRVNRDWVMTDDAFVAGHLIDVKAQSGGTIVEIMAENTQQVEQGQVLARLDGARARLDLQQAEAELGETLRQIAALKAGIEARRQRIIARSAALSRVRDDLRRLQAASAEGAVSEQKVQNARDRVRELSAEIAAAVAEKAVVEAQIPDGSVATHPAVEKAKSRLRRAYLEYRRQHVLAPASGYVAKRRAHVGDRIEAGATLMVIVPLSDLWVEANFLETEIGGIRPGQPAEIRVDAYAGGVVYHGRVLGLNPGTGSAFALLPTDNSTGNFIHITERVPVRIALDSEELRNNPLQPGLSTVTRINIGAAGGLMLQSAVKTDDEAYRTRIYDDELAGVEKLIEDIVAANRGSP
ncbi:MAG: efflux RND transporter periplasmic adaptor subunit [Gammaproteobacteria bacterium]